MEAANRYHKLPGFNKYPFDCFGVSKCMVDQDSAWVGGFFNPDAVIYYIIKKNIDLWNPEKKLPSAVDSAYDMEAKQIAKRIKINHTVEQLAEIIEQVCFEEFGWKHDTKYCIEIAEAIYKDLNEEFRENVFCICLILVKTILLIYHKYSSSI